MSRSRDDAFDPRDFTGQDSQINNLFWRKLQPGDVAICDECLAEYTVVKGSKQQRRSQPKCPRCSKGTERCPLTRVRLEKVKSRLDWKSADQTARNWWRRLESENSNELEKILDIAQQLEAKKATIQQFFNAYKQSGARGVAANMLFMQYMQEKAAEILTSHVGLESPIPKLPLLAVCGIPATAEHGVAVVLESFGDKKLEIVKIVKQMTCLSLMDCKRLVEQAPTIIGRCETETDASVVVDAINAAGGHAYVE